jgi:hypothetical protein
MRFLGFASMMLPTPGLMTTIDTIHDGGFGASQGWCGGGSAACPH